MKRIFKWLITSATIVVVVTMVSLLIIVIGKYCFPLLIVMGIVCVLYVGYDISKS